MPFIPGPATLLGFQTAPTWKIPGALNGIEINQNQPPADTDHGIQLGNAWYYQQFQLPADYARGGTNPPMLSGIQVKSKVPKHLTNQATIDYTLDYREGSRWITISSGTSIGATAFGDEVWFTINFENPTTVTLAMLNETFRFGVKGRQTAPVHKRHKCLPIRRWQGKWHYYNHTHCYGNNFADYDYDNFYLNYPYYEWGYYGFPYYYNYPWWGEYWGDFLGVNSYLPWASPWGWNWPYSYYNSNFYNNFYWNYYGYPYAPNNFYDYFYDRYLPNTDPDRWWNHWDEWEWEADEFPLIPFDDGKVPDDLFELEEEVPYLIDDFDGFPCYLYKHRESEKDEQWGFHHKYCLHTQQGIDWLWFSSPNPYVRVQDSFVTDHTETQVLQDGTTISFMFRLLSLSADSGTDELGMQYRNTVIIHGVDNLDTTQSQNHLEKNWISKPNPSKFAVENLFADISQSGVPQVIDRIYMDPITPNVYFSVYYSDEGLPGVTIVDWEKKLWTRIPKTFKLTKADSYALPFPITAKYINIEFSYLQAKPYSAPDLAQPILYKKYPKWVLDYFVAREAANTSQFVSNAVSVTYNAFDLAYNYYLDDIQQGPQPPGTSLPSIADVNNFFSNRSDLSDKIDMSMLRQINLIINPYLQVPLAKSNFNFLITQYSNINRGDVPYPVEGDPQTLLPQITANVSSLNRDQVIVEQGMPIMYFYLPSRHIYREVMANFSSGVSYQVGLNAIAFQREHYTVKFDSPFYLESGGDNVNIEQNDFVRVDNAWAVYAKAANS